MTWRTSAAAQDARRASGEPTARPASVPSRIASSNERGPSASPTRTTSTPRSSSSSNSAESADRPPFSTSASTPVHRHSAGPRTSCGTRRRRAGRPPAAGGGRARRRRHPAGPGTCCAGTGGSPLRTSSASDQPHGVSAGGQHLGDDEAGPVAAPVGDHDLVPDQVEAVQHVPRLNHRQALRRPAARCRGPRRSRRDAVGTLGENRLGVTAVPERTSQPASHPSSVAIRAAAISACPGAPRAWRIWPPTCPDRSKTTTSCPQAFAETAAAHPPAPRR